jgi:signal transduction histidine kinase
MSSPEAHPTTLPWPLILTFVLLAVSVALGGYLYYLRQERSVVAEHEGDLAAVADLKVSQLAHWRHERISDARMLSGSEGLAGELERYLSLPSDPVLAARLERRLALLSHLEDYTDAILCDADGSIRMSVPPSPPSGADCAGLTSEAAQRRSAFLSDFIRGPDGKVRLFSVAPILGRKSKIAGAIVLAIDPAHEVYDLVKSWPAPSPTAEILLVERRGDRVVFVSPLRRRANEPLLFSLPVTRKDLPAAQAVMGHEGVVSGVDYTGTPVLGAARHVPDTPWYVVAKINRSEVQAPIRASALETVVVSILLILFAGTAVILFWRQQQARYFRQRYEAEWRHRGLLESAEAELRRANRALRMLTDCNEALIRASEEQRLLKDLCRIAVDVGGYRMAWVGMAEHDQGKSVRVAAKAGSDNGYLETAAVTWADEPRGRTPMESAIREGRPVVVRTNEAAEHLAYRQFADSSGIAVGAGLPLHVEGGVIGAIAVYSADAGSFDPGEMEILEELAEDLAFGIQTIRRRDAQTAAEEALLQSQKLESIGRLAGGLAHDFNNYLTVINGYCDVLLDRLQPEDPTRAQVAEIRKSGGRAAELTERLLAFSRRQVSNPNPCSLNEILRDVENILRSAAGSAVDLVLDPAPDLGLVMADPVQIHQVLLNLVINASDAMPSGGRIEVRTSNVAFDQAALPPTTAAEPGEYVVLTVRDTGTGMDEQTRGHIFEPFFTTKPSGQGTGLGLSTVYGIVQQSGGWISVDSEPGQGTTFRIGFPRCRP